jgi:hypothetical protein
VPMLTCGFVRSNLAFATVDPCPLGLRRSSLVRLFVNCVVETLGLADRRSYSPVAFAMLIARLRGSLRSSLAAMLTPLSPSR